MSTTEPKREVEDYPEYIRMRGLPFLLQGCNNVYKRKTDEQGNVYYSQTYIYMGSAYRVRLIKINDRWELYRDGDNSSFGIHGKRGCVYPMGKWTYGARVEETG